MIVFGDPSFSRPASELVQSLRERLRALAGDRTQSESVREALIFSGQVEQAIADAADAQPGDSDLAASLLWCEAATDALAAMLIADAHHRTRDHNHSLAALRWHHGGAPAGSAVTVKVPEGYAFYSLYPDQYAAAACAWARVNHAARCGPVLIIGLRSIGTSLSAVVRATLAREGWRATRLTIRPNGAHTDRTVKLPPVPLPKVTRVLIVDEGPGQSGTSFAAAAQAVHMHGIPREHICFLPSHQNELGAAATATAREWWGSTTKYTASTNVPILDGRSLRDHLREHTRHLLDDDVDEGTNLSGGLWRSHTFKSEREWPGVFALLDREKYLYRARSTRRAILWKFAGIATGADGLTGSERDLRRLTVLARGGLTPAVLGSTLGFIAFEWTNARPLTRAALSARVLHHIARYLTHTPAPPLSRDETRAAVARATNILYWNTKKSLGDQAAEVAQQLCHEAHRLHLDDLTSAAPDGRLAPHEWILTPDDRILKADAAGHAHDHTAVGPQPLAWDLAGTSVEWDLTAEQSEQFVSLLRASGEHDLRPDLLRFCIAAYAAFRLGCCAMAADCAGRDEDERTRLQREQRYYERHLRRALNLQPSVDQ
ncbi:MAG TPA: hypothetical protein VD997_09445 [Phycisphaerales bacterium]|nr:hypothetical protein [Phycisphaerales bacterium]